METVKKLQILATSPVVTECEKYEPTAQVRPEFCDKLSEIIREQRQCGGNE